MEDETKIRAAFDYMGPKTQASLTLEALAKGAGILIKFKDDEIAKLKAEVAKLFAHEVAGVIVENDRDKMREERDAALLQKDALEREIKTLRQSFCMAHMEEPAVAGCVHCLNRQISAYEAALHKIACAECSVHDDLCERHRFKEPMDYCACDARVAGDQVHGYKCPAMEERSPEKRISDNGACGPHGILSCEMCK